MQPHRTIEILDDLTEPAFRKAGCTVAQWGEILDMIIEHDLLLERYHEVVKACLKAQDEEQRARCMEQLDAEARFLLALLPDDDAAREEH